MNPEQAKQILWLYRPGSSDANNPDVMAALEAVDQDPELRRWFEQHCAFQKAARDKLRSISAPPGLKARLLAGPKILRPRSWWREPAVLAAAAALVLLGSLALFLMQPRAPDRFADFRFRMVRTALREYRMDILTNDMPAVRRFLANRGAPADYVVPRELNDLALTGAGSLRWRNHPVSMVCFDRGDSQMLFLFVLDRGAVKDAPPATPQFAEANKLLTTSWTKGDNVYLLAGPEDSKAFHLPKTNSNSGGR